MSSQCPVLDDKPIDQWKVAELREELRRRKLVAKGLKEELVKRLDEAMRKELDSENGVEMGNGVESNAVVSQNDSDDEDEELEREEITQPLLSNESNKNSKYEVTVDDDGGFQYVNHGSEDQKGNVDVVSGLAGTDEKEATADSSGGQNVIIQSDTQVEDTEHARKNDDQNEDSGNAQSEQSNQVSEISQDLVLQVKYASISTDSVSINEKNTVMDNLNADNFPLELEDIKQVVQPSFNSYSSSGGDSLMVGDEQVACTNCVKNEQVATENHLTNEQVEIRDFSTDEQEFVKNFVSDGQEVGRTVSSDETESNNINASNKQGSTQNHVSLQQPFTEEHTQNAPVVGSIKTEDSTGAGSPEKLNLDRSSGDESMEEDLLEGKLMEVDFKSEEPVSKTADRVLDVLEKKPVFDAVEKVSQEVNNFFVENVQPTIPMEKRKLEETETVGNNDVPKRQRRWNTDSIKIPKQQMPHLSIPTTPKNIVQPALHRSFSRSSSTLGTDSFKERIVPSPKKPATTSLRIDNFLRPFTLKAVQELLAKTGKVSDFWMDHIKTHCYVTFSSVEEATETRNAVYNLQWPPNGGRHLAAEFVDPQEVKVRSEAPPQSPATPITPSLTTTPKAPPPTLANQTQAPQPTRPQHFQQLPLPPPPPLAHPSPLAQPLPPPLFLNPPIARERLPPPPKNPEPPALTLDDLFKKTKSTPWIYYLPLSEEQVAAKLAAQGKDARV